jgi:predicted transcriptional regulator
MQTAKQDVEQLLKNLPNDSSYEDIQYHLYVLEKIRHGQRRADTGETLTQEQTEARVSRWLTK